MKKVPYNKPHATPESIVKQLLKRGLVISNISDATETIRKLGYARLRLYAETRCESDNPARPFWPNVKFEDIVELHNSDYKIREVCWEPVGHIEILFRNSIAETLSSYFESSHPYEKTIADNLRGYNHLLDIFVDAYLRAKKSKHVMALEYEKQFTSPVNGPDLPPIWYMKEMLTFGEVVSVFNKLKTHFQQTILSQFGLTDPEIFENWMWSFNELRNICAHHEPVFNRQFKQMVKVQKLPIAHGDKVPTNGVQLNRLAAVLQCLDHVLLNRLGDLRVDRMNIEPKVEEIVGASGGVIKRADVGW